MGKLRPREGRFAWNTCWASLYHSRLLLPIPNAHLHGTHLCLWPTDWWRDVNHAVWQTGRQECWTPDWMPQFPPRSARNLPVRPISLALPSLLSWSLPTQCLAIVLQMRGLVGRAGPVPSALLLPCLSWSLIAIKLFKPKRQITIISVCVHLVCVCLLRGEAPFPAAGK